ncbi:protein of unknown function [Nitratireductor aquimarinus]
MDTPTTPPPMTTARAFVFMVSHSLDRIPANRAGRLDDTHDPKRS